MSILSSGHPFIKLIREDSFFHRWTPGEDEKLLAYIQEHVHGSWRALPSKAGLQKCGKSCRLRWINYLRPDIKRGKFTLQEEQTIIQLHALLESNFSDSRNTVMIKNFSHRYLRMKSFMFLKANKRDSDINSVSSESYAKDADVNKEKTVFLNSKQDGVMKKWTQKRLDSKEGEIDSEK